MQVDFSILGEDGVKAIKFIASEALSLKNKKNLSHEESKYLMKLQKAFTKLKKEAMNKKSANEIFDELESLAL